MNQYTEISNAYQGCAQSFFFIEGKSDKALNRYVRANLKSIGKHLGQRGVHYEAFRIVSPSFFGMKSLKNLILRQCPTLDKDELSERIKVFKSNQRSEGRSRLLYISRVMRNSEGNCVADILCEDNFDKDGDDITTLYKFLDIVVRLDIANETAGTHGAEYKYRLPDEEDDGPSWDNGEYLACDLLADSITGEVCNDVSPIRFDDKFNISLPLYPQISIKLDPLPKSLYILFLLHPEGIRLKDIHDYEGELRGIYGAVSGRKNPTVLNKMFKALTDPTGNQLHKNISIIRRCFLSKLRSDLATHYIPAHSRAQAHSIPLDLSLVELPK